MTDQSLTMAFCDGLVLIPTASKRGIQLTSRSRPLGPSDFGGFDYIIGMDEVNMEAINSAANYWQARAKGSVIPTEYK